MNIGMLWFDNDPKTELNAKIERATSYYRNKYGKTPNVCFVHPSMIGASPTPNGNETLKSGTVEVHTSPSIRPNHFWIGVNGTLQANES